MVDKSKMSLKREPMSELIVVKQSWEMVEIFPAYTYFEEDNHKQSV
jgi:hypothetical protein